MFACVYDIITNPHYLVLLPLNMSRGRTACFFVDENKTRVDVDRVPAERPRGLVDRLIGII